MDKNLWEGQLTRSSLGRLGFIGELYDVRTESFSSRSLLNRNFPPELIQRRDIGRMEFDYKIIENTSDHFEMLNVEAELQLSVLLGLVNVEGWGKFLTEEKRSKKRVSCSLICKLLSVSEKLFASFDEILPYIDLSVLKDPQYTHLIAEVSWGANCFLSLESNFNSSEEKQKIAGDLSMCLKKLKGMLSVGGSGNLQKDDLEMSKNNNISIKICADVVPNDGWPTSIESFCEFIKEIPVLLKNVNEGKGKPLNYVLIPLNTIRKMAELECNIDMMVRKIDESFLLSTVYFFDEISQNKQNLNDVLNIMNENKKYVVDENLKETKKHLKNLLVKESELKSIISEDWVLVKSGEKTLKDLIKRVEKFKNHELNLSTYEDFLNSCESTLQKISFVKNHISLGVIYLGNGEKFNSVLAKYLSFEFIVLVISSEIEKADPDLYRDTWCFFLSVVNESDPKIKYVVVDFDFVKEECFFSSKITQAKCYHLKGNKIICSDLYSNYLAESEKNFAQLEKGLVEYCQHKPGNRTVVEIMCPGFEAGTCPPDPLKWCCFNCKNYLEYGFDDNFYCYCGKGPAGSFKFRCSNFKHGSFFISPRDELLSKAISKLRPLKELNVLILGQSGVGKSTWINSIINYLTYDSLENARENGVISTIPLSFVMYDVKTFKEHFIKFGNPTNNEVTEVGASGTQCAHTYNFLWEDRYVRLIDTPGLGDARGIIQDKENLDNIIEHLGHLNEIHGVCILFKANENRINAFFNYCLKELLINLHKSVAKNVVFCFTNARNTYYTPGQTSALLNKIIEGLGVKNDLALGRNNTFCLDNEAFLYLCSLQDPEFCHDEKLVPFYAQSWEVSLNETRRLFNTIKSFEPHLLTETISLVTSRNKILSLTKPLAEISKTIQMNVAALKRKEKEISASELAIEELSKKLHFTEIRLEPVKISNPRTVCTSPSCVDYVGYGNLDVSEIEYKTHCHPQCHLKNVTPKTVNNADLKNCLAMSDGKCTVCKCGWENHMHLTYHQRRVEQIAVNKNVEKDILNEISEKEKIEKFVNDLKETIEKYKTEQETIIKTCVKFGMFLRRNAISVYNDSVEDYLTYLIKTEEDKLNKTETEKTLIKQLQETLNHYKTEIQILENVIKEGNNGAEELTAQQVYELEQKLYTLELTGNEIRKSVEMSRATNKKMMEYGETPLLLHKTPTFVFEEKKNYPIKGRIQKLKDCLITYLK